MRRIRPTLAGRDNSLHSQIMSRQYFQNLTAALFCVALAACGGGGGGNDDRSSSQTESTTGNTGNDTGSSGSDGNGTSNPDGDTSSPPSDNAGGDTPGTTPPSSGSGGGTPPSSGSGDGGSNTGSPTAPTFSAQLVSSPTTRPAIYLGEEIAGTPNPAYFEVSGTNLGNVELVSAKDESIIYGRFTISEDKTRATFEWTDFMNFGGESYGVFEARILAWDVPPGESGNRIEVMGPTSYYVRQPLGCGNLGTCGGVAP